MSPGTPGGRTDHPALFDVTPPRLPAGRVRRGLDVDVTSARVGGTELAAAGVATLRTLADQIDALERFCRRPEAKPYDRVPLAGLIHEFGETYDRTFAVARSDPLDRALERFLGDDDRPDPAAPAGDAANPGAQ